MRACHASAVVTGTLSAYLAGYRFAKPELRTRQRGRGWTLDRLVAELVARDVEISRGSLGEIERHVCRAAPKLQASAARVLGTTCDTLFEPEEEDKLRRRAQEGDYVR